MDVEVFLKSVQKKKFLNKSQGVPKLRAVAILHATSKRLLLERKKIKRERGVSTDFDEKFVAKKLKLDIDVGIVEIENDLDESEEIDVESTDELSFLEPCTMVAEKDLHSNISFWDELSHLEDILKQIDRTIVNNNNYIENSCESSFSLEYDRYSDDVFACP